MWAEVIMCSYAGLACLARASHRFNRLTLPGGRIAGRKRARLTGVLFLVLAMTGAIAGLGPRQGLVAFALVLSVVGMTQALLLSVRPRAALAITFPLLVPGSVPGRHHTTD